ncbi:MAG: GHKL domain-containing protein [Bacilli bacterium]|nr:GHKL domain-containing protein [Bacilli bacterium]
MLYRKAIADSFIASIIVETGAIVAEIIFCFMILIVFPKIDLETFVTNFFGKLFSNFIIFLNILLLAELKFYNKFFNTIHRFSKGVRKTRIINSIILVLICYNIIFAMYFENLKFGYMVTINSFLLLLYGYIIYLNLKMKNNYFRLSSKYDDTIHNLKEYEKMIDVYRISNHENKNQLLTVRNMIVNKDKNITAYIDKIVDNKLNDDDKIMYETSIIPEGGLRATIYSKILLMKHKKIKYNLDVDRKVRDVELTILKDEEILNICKVIGVFLDNAIDSSLNEKSKIDIKLYLDNTFNIEISNKVKGKVNLKLIDKEGYTTKEHGHGYGLPLVKSIIATTRILDNITKIEDDIFIQTLKIKYKKK